MCICDPLIQNLPYSRTCYWEKLHGAAIMKTPKKHPIFQNGCCSGVSVNPLSTTDLEYDVSLVDIMR